MAKATGPARESLVETRDPDEFATILKQSFKPRSDRAASEVENAVTTLVREALADTAVIKDDVLDTIEGRSSSRSKARGVACTTSCLTPRRIPA